MHSSIKDPMFTQTVEHDWRSQLLIKCKFIIFLLSIITFPLSSKFREIMLFFLCSLYIKYVVSLNISIVSITTLNQYLAVNSQQLPEIPKKSPELPPLLNRIDWQCSFNSAAYSHDVTTTDGLTDVRHSLLNTIQLLLNMFS